MTEAEEAAAHWGGEALVPLRDRENTVVAMRLPGGRAVLRLHRRGYQEEGAIRSELWWQAALAEAGLPVPRPVPSLAGSPLVHLSTGRFATALSWLPGEPLGLAGRPLSGTPEAQVRRHHALGRLIARVHDATDALALPDWFERPRWDLAGLVGEAPRWGRFWAHPALAPAEAARLREVRAALRRAIGDHAGAGDLGLIHADVLRENVLVDDRGLSLIDFDDSGFGFRAYDLGTVLSQDQRQPNRDDLRAALIEGYRSLRPVDAAMVDAFTLMRCCASVGWAMTRLPAGDPVHRSHIDRALMLADRIL